MLIRMYSTCLLHLICFDVTSHGADHVHHANHAADSQLPTGLDLGLLMEAKRSDQHNAACDFCLKRPQLQGLEETAAQGTPTGDTFQAQ